MEMIELDGSQGEGGGQILRTALSLSMITGTPFRIERIRAGRAKPGLLRQHLTAVNAAAAICGAEVSGAELGARQLVFHPGVIRAGDYRFAIGSAGSATLVLQTVLPALWHAAGPSTVAVSGGTHKSAAPPADFLQVAWLPLLARMGAEMRLDLLRHGFYPAGGGELVARVAPCPVLRPLWLADRGTLQQASAKAVFAGLPAEIAKRELAVLEASLTAGLGGLETELLGLPAREGPGNVVMVRLAYAGLTELFTAFGEKGVAAEQVASRLAQGVLAHQASGATVGEYLADQLLLPIALAGGGGFSVAALSSHLHTNIAVIERFLPLRFAVRAERAIWRVELNAGDRP